MTRRARALALLCALTASGVEAQQLSPDGAMLFLAGKTIALPGPGWRPLWADRRDGVATIALLRESGGSLRGLVLIRTNEQPRSAIFPTTRRCEQIDSYFAEIRYDTVRDGYCQWSSLLRADWAEAAARNGDGDRFVHELSSALDSAGVNKPRQLLEFGARVRTIAHMIDLRLYAPHDLPAPIAATPGWFASGARAALPAGAVKTIDGLKAWSTLAQGRLEDSVRIISGLKPLPDPLEPRTEPASAERLARIDRTAAARLPQAYLDTARRDVSQGDPPENEVSWSLWKRSLAKVATYRVASGLDSISVGWLITGSAAQGFGFAGIDAVLAPALAYANEIFWATSGVGAPSAPLTPQEFPEIGEDLAQAPPK